MKIIIILSFLKYFFILLICLKYKDFFCKSQAQYVLNMFLFFLSNLSLLFLFGVLKKRKACISFFSFFLSFICSFIFSLFYITFFLYFFSCVLRDSTTRFVGPSICPSVFWSVRPSVCHSLLFCLFFFLRSLASLYLPK